jgi:FtsZ-binding cell division protein ZapB
MKIINPIYDLAFKYLMENIGMAKKVISVIIEEEIEEIELLPPDNTMIDVEKILRGIRLDFKAKIGTKNGEHLTVIIEMQKLDDPDPIIRFRRYLGRTYLKYETIEYENKNKKPDTKLIAYPIIAIYILGFNLKDIETPSAKINPLITDTTNKEILDVKNEFIEMLNHRSYILQVRRLRPDRRTRVERLLSLFDQKKISDNPYILDMPSTSVDPEFQEMAEYLHLPVTSDEFIRQMEFYDDVNRSLTAKEENLLQAKIEIKEKTEQLQQSKEELQQSKEELQQSKEELQQSKEISQEKDKLIDNLAKLLKESGISDDEIHLKTGLPIDEICKL